MSKRDNLNFLDTLWVSEARRIWHSQGISKVKTKVEDLASPIWKTCVKWRNRHNRLGKGSNFAKIYKGWDFVKGHDHPRPDGTWHIEDEIVYLKLSMMRNFREFCLLDKIITLRSDFSYIQQKFCFLDTERTFTKLLDIRSYKT